MVRLADREQRATTQLRRLIERGDMVVAAGAHDALSARIIESVGFDAISVSGLGLETILLGVPDMGLLTHNEIGEHLGRMADAVHIPVLGDAEAGFGGVVNVTRMVRDFERAGIAGIHIEDQTNPKKCPWLAGREVVPRDEAVGRVRAACDARTDPDFVIIARCDADEVSVEEVIERCKRYLDAGADMAMPMLIRVDGRSVNEMPLEERRELHARVCQEIDGPLASARIVPGFDQGDMRDVGYKWLTLGTHAISACIEAQMRLWKHYLAHGDFAGYFEERPLPSEVQPDRDVPPAHAIMNFLGLDEWLELEREYGPAPAATPA